VNDVKNDEHNKTRLRAAHENLPEGEVHDDLGMWSPQPASSPGRRYPATDDFPTGPAIGDRIPDFTLSDQDGVARDFHADRAGGKAMVVFYRSANW